MQYCVYYNKKVKNIQAFDELIISYNNNKDNLIDFLVNSEKDFKRIIIDITEKELDLITIEFFIELKKKYSNIILRIDQININKISLLKEKNIPFFINSLIQDWEQFNQMVYLGVSDIYISGELGFDLIRLSKKAKEKNIKLRAFPNMAQANWTELESILKFFIRPEDTPLYESYIDIFEFFGKPEQMNILLKVYQKDKKWFGPLEEIIFNLKSQTEIDNRFILPGFGKQRLGCQRQCLKGEKCKLCFTIQQLAESLKKSNLMVELKENEEEEKEWPQKELF